MNWFHEVNKLYDGALNKIHHFFYSTDIPPNETFTFRKGTKQQDIISFLDTMRKEIHDHEEGIHWNVVHRNTIPNKSRPIKSIWSFKRKRKPDEEILKHKARQCANIGMKKWGDSYW